MAAMMNDYPLQLRRLVDEFERLVRVAAAKQERLEQRLAELELDSAESS